MSVAIATSPLAPTVATPPPEALVASLRALPAFREASDGVLARGVATVGASGR